MRSTISLPPLKDGRDPVCLASQVKSKRFAQEDYETNLAFGGADFKPLSVTAGASIYKIPVGISGYAAHPPLRRGRD
jgi:hypothetical protein